MPATNPDKTLAKEEGRKWYKGGKTCPNGHTWRRYVSNNTCVECILENNKKGK